MQLLDHVSITVRRLADVKPFYLAIFRELGADLVYERPDAIGFGTRNDADDAGHSYLSLLASDNAVADPKRHTCFRAGSVEAVMAFHRAGLAAGGTDAGAPGLRDYHPGYFAAFLLDPEGNKVEAVFHQAGQRPATGAQSLSGASADLTVRDLQAGDIEAVRQFLCAHGWSHRLDDPDRFRRLVLGSQRTAVATVDGQVIGFARGITDGVSNGYLSMVAVVEGFRRKGLGRQLVQHVVGRDPGVTWVLRAERAGAEDFFAALGFALSRSAMELRRAP